ncbi:MAG: KilA-N domain-containing protein [Oscillospiraceae bacterium]|nr:KilA-N domain-containing protein [Oscillospiraceae bacterium]
MSVNDVKSVIHAKDTDISIISSPGQDDYISLTDIARYRSDDPTAVISNWMRAKDTIEFLGLWEQLNNPNFKPLEFEGFKNEAGANAFTLSPKKWISATDAIGLISKSGRYGGTFAHKDIAFEFASWVSPEFKLYIIKDYQRLKSDEAHQLALDWNVKRLISKANYKIHTEAIKQNLIPPDVSSKRQGFVYANEADVLNVALFGMTAAEWRKSNPEAKGNMRDYATIEQLLVLANLESTNAMLIEAGKSREERAITLNKLAISQLKTLSDNASLNKLKSVAENTKLLPSE